MENRDRWPLHILIEMKKSGVKLNEYEEEFLNIIFEIRDTNPKTKNNPEVNQNKNYPITQKALENFIEKLIGANHYKPLAKEVYENEKEFYFKEFGLGVSFEEFWSWVKHFHSNHSLEWIKNNLTYEILVSDFNKSYAKSRIVRKIIQGGHYNLKVNESQGDNSINSDFNSSIKVNKFNGMSLDEVEKWFMKLSTNTSNNGRLFLSVNDLKLFIDRAFLKKTGVKKLTLNFGPKEKLFVWKLFYQYYLNCICIETGVERGTQCRDKYIRLLTDNFTNFTFDEVKANFAKSNSIVGEWN
ncbi:hypothetical protein GCM10028803_46140 [Larkinella knui]|uniref:Uncharacterized protein n=1 Tax=Larkinella knui TaxID=2025310 RepID=A0A3P1CPG7_9BACT|nr:hypothetical protein [Larkinella knui]RRB15212.1 hypothetical protein EHT87_11760 [Larkinella knui]